MGDGSHSKKTVHTPRDGRVCTRAGRRMMKKGPEEKVEGWPAPGDEMGGVGVTDGTGGGGDCVCHCFAWERDASSKLGDTSKDILP